MLWETLLGRFIEVYADEDATLFDVGKLIAYDDDWILIHSFDKNGQSEGNLLIRGNTIFRVNYETQYIKALGIQDPNEPAQFAPGTNLWDEVLRERKIVSVTLLNGDVACGLLAERADRYLRIYEKDEAGEDDGVSIVFREDIACVQCDHKIS